MQGIFVTVDHNLMTNTSQKNQGCFGREGVWREVRRDHFTKCQEVIWKSILFVTYHNTVTHSISLKAFIGLSIVSPDSLVSWILL